MPDEAETLDIFEEGQPRHHAAGGRWLGALRIVAWVAGVVWVVSRSYYSVRTASAPDSFNTSDLFNQLRWADAIANICYVVFLFAAGLYVIEWLRRRDNSSA